MVWFWVWVWFGFGLVWSLVSEKGLVWALLLVGTKTAWTAEGKEVWPRALAVEVDTVVRKGCCLVGFIYLVYQPFKTFKRTPFGCSWFLDFARGWKSDLLSRTKVQMNMPLLRAGRGVMTQSHKFVRSSNDPGYMHSHRRRCAPAPMKRMLKRDLLGVIWSLFSHELLMGGLLVVFV